jgi:release factor glutamine methyltransferase
MLKLKQEILDLFAQHGHEKSPEAEANLILFNAYRHRYPVIHKFSEILQGNFSDKFPMTSEIEEEAMKMANHRIKGIPLQHITGNQFFFEHDYIVNQHVLIPRPETEILISTTLDHISKVWPKKAFRFAELGLGSGILSIEILSHFKQAMGFASEVSPQAIAVARQNLDHILGPGNWEDRFSIIEPGDSHVAFEVFTDYKPMDLIVSNPPYVSVNDEIESEVLRHEPHGALFPMVGGTDEGGKEKPNFFYENFLHHHARILKQGGVAFFEIPHERANEILHEFQNAGFHHATLIQDLTGRARVLMAQK